MFPHIGKISTYRLLPANTIRFKLISALLILLSSLFCQAEPIELRTAYQDSFPKYYSYNQPEKAAQGLCIDILCAIEKTAGITIKAPFGFLPFKRLQNQLARGEIDIFIGMAKSKSRLEKYTFLDTPLYAVHHTLGVRQDDTVQINSLDDIANLAPNNIILTNFGTATEHLLKAHGGLNVDSEGATIKANLKKLIYGRGRFICFHDLGLKAAIRQHGYSEKIRVLPITLRTYYHYIAFAPGTSSEVIARVDLALQKLQVEGTLAAIHAKYVGSPSGPTADKLTPVNGK